MVDTNNDDARRADAETRARLLAQVMALIRAAAGPAGRLTIASIKAAMPLLELISGTRADAIEGGGEAGRFGLTRGQLAVLNALATKLVLESIEVASVTHPIYEGAPVYVATIDGVRQPPHLVHLLALLAVVRAFLADDDEGEGEEEPVFLPAGQTVAFLAVAPGEFALSSGPLPPIEIRRAAMRQRAFSQPQAAMLVVGSDPAMIAASASAQPMTARAGRGPAGAALAAVLAAAVGGGDCGCGCGGHAGGCGCQGDDGCGCGCHEAESCGCGRGGACRCGHGHRFAPARYNPDGSCASVFPVSCDTRWRMRDCLKVALCDFLRCFGEEACDEDCRFAEDPDLGRCVETFVCTFLGCLPDAICPPPDKPARRRIARPAGCGCNFAVGD